jgi:Xaa-Pro dipeptidase
MTLLTRSTDVRQARYTSVLDDVRVWLDAPDADPARTDLKPILDEHGCRGKTLGVEWESYGLTARNGFRLKAALDGFCALDDASDLVSRLRAVKSPAELVYVRRAAELADDALREAQRLAVPGAFEGDVMAAMQGAIYKGGGDDSANEWNVLSGPAALLSRYQTGRRHFDADDQFNIEFAGVYRHYHCGLYRTIKVGKANPKHRDMYLYSAESLEACKKALRPGHPVGDVFDTYKKMLEKGGYGGARLNACGYSLGATYAPTWMDWPMFFHGNAVLAEPGMVFFIIPGVRNDAEHLVALAAETVLVTENGCERLSKVPLDYTHNP